MTTFRNSLLMPSGTGSSHPETFGEPSPTMFLIRILNRTVKTHSNPSGSYWPCATLHSSRFVTASGSAFSGSSLNSM
ncbi:MAG: hypothetical protein ACK56F_05365, partial [bacterium]